MDAWQHLASMLIAQGPDAASSNPWTLVAGGSGVLGAVMFVTSRIDKWVDAWRDERRRDKGADPEHAAKLETRSEVKAQSEALARVAASVEETAKVNAKLLEELAQMRRESFQAHANIQAALAVKQ